MTILLPQIPLAKLDASGTPSSSTYLRGDGTWATITGGGDFFKDGSVAMTGALDLGGNSIIDLADVTFRTGASGGTLRTGTSAADKFTLQAYDTNGGAYVTVIELDAGNVPVLQLIADFLEIDDDADTTKRVAWDISGATTGTATTLTFAQTAARSIAFPDASGTLELEGHTHAASEITSGTLASARGGTGVGAPSQGDLLVGSGLSAWTRLAKGTGPVVATVATGAGTVSWQPMPVEKSAFFDGGGSAPTVDAGVQVPVLQGGTIGEALLVATDDNGARASDSLTVTVYKVSSGGAETTLGTIALSAASYNHDTTLSGWTTSVSAGDTLRFKLTSAGSTATRVAVSVFINPL